MCYKLKHYYKALFRGVARTVVMCRHLNETVGFNEAHSAEWGRRSPDPGGHPREIFEKYGLI